MIGIIGGSGVEEISELADSIEKITVDTEYGSVEVSLLSIEDKTVAFFQDTLQVTLALHIKSILRQTSWR